MNDITPERQNLARWHKAWELLQDVVKAIGET
jgi:hypothetical protein